MIVAALGLALAPTNAQETNRAVEQAGKNNSTLSGSIEKRAILIRVEKQIKPILAGMASNPPACVLNSDGTYLTVSYETQKFMVHRSDMTGDWSSNAVEEVGPKRKGITLHVSVEPLGYPNQLWLPQTQHEPYWDTYVNVTPVSGTTNQLWWLLSYGSSAADKGIVKRLQEAIESLNGPDVASRIPGEPGRRPETNLSPDGALKP